jgi:hypothetical protein
MVWEAVLKGLGPTAISYMHTVSLDLSLACNPRPLRQGAEEEKSLRSRDHPVCLQFLRVVWIFLDRWLWLGQRLGLWWRSVQVQRCLHFLLIS